MKELAEMSVQEQLSSVDQRRPLYEFLWYELEFDSTGAVIDKIILDLIKI